MSVRGSYVMTPVYLSILAIVMLLVRSETLTIPLLIYFNV